MSWSRRRFLRGAGGALVAAPLLPTLARRAGAAELPAPPKRLVCFYTGNGFYEDQFMPSGAGADFALQGALLPLAAHRDRLIIGYGAQGGDGHYVGHTEALTGRPAVSDSFTAAGGPSLDQLVAEGLKGQTPLPSLELGVEPWSSADGMISYTASGLAIPPVADPGGAFDRVYSLASEDPETAERRRAQGLSVLDAVMADVADLQPHLSAGERRLLDEHLTLLREREQSLLNPVEIEACEVGEAPVSGGSSFTFEEATGHHISTLVSALRCDVTRVASLVLKGSQDTTLYSWAGATSDYHTVAHGEASDSDAQMLAVNTWQASQFAALLDQLDAIPEGDGTALDNTLVFWTNELGLHRWGHERDNMGVVIAGATGALQTGQLLNMGGYLYQDLLFTLAHAMGYTELTGFGDDGTRLIEAMLRA